MENERKKTFKQRKQMKKKSVIFFFFAAAIFTRFMSKSSQIWQHSFPLFFLKDSKNLKSVHIGLREVGTKRPLKGGKNTNTKKFPLSVAKFPQKHFFCAAISHPLLVKVFTSEITSFHYISPRIPNL